MRLVYARLYYDLRTIISPSMRFDMSLQNFKKPFVDYISANRKKKTFRRLFSYSVDSHKNQNILERGLHHNSYTR